MVKARKNRQPRNWANVTHMRSGSGFISNLPNFTNAKLHGVQEQTKKHVETRLFGKKGRKNQVVWEKDGKKVVENFRMLPDERKETVPASISFEEIPVENQKGMVVRSIQKQRKRLKRYNQLAAQHNGTDASDYRAKAQRCQDLISEKIQTLKELDKRILAKQKKQETQAINEKKSAQVEHMKFSDLVFRLEKSGELEKRRKFAEANATLFKGEENPDKFRKEFVKVDGKIKRNAFKTFSEQPRKIRETTVVKVINKNKRIDVDGNPIAKTQFRPYKPD